MPQVNTDPKAVKEVLERGVEQIMPAAKDLERKLLSGERIRLYCGFDPSAPSLHIGNAICLNKLGQFQKLGHEVIFLIGDFTGMIGDPTDKSATRAKLTREEVNENAKGFVEQASGYLEFEGENPAQIKRNSEWSDKLTFRDLIELSSNFTVQQMIQRDMFQNRIKEEKPVHLHEFLYPLAQGYDSVAMDVDLEVGGNDQMFNMMAGRDLMKALGMRDKAVMTLRLLADETGKKMGKTEGNAVFLDQKPEEMFGKVMSWTDGTILPGLELATRVPMTEIAAIEKELKNGANPIIYKKRLAWETVKINFGEEAANKAQAHFEQVFGKKENPDEMPEFALQGEMNILDLMTQAFGFSKSEGRRLIAQGGVKFENEAVLEIDLAIKKPGVLQVGKRKFLRIK